MSSNDIVNLTYLSNDTDLDGKKILNYRHDDDFRKEIIKVLEEGLKEILEVTIENKK